MTSGKPTTVWSSERIDHVVDRRWSDVVKRDMRELSRGWNGDTDHEYDREERKNLVLSAKGLNDF